MASLDTSNFQFSNPELAAGLLQGSSIGTPKDVAKANTISPTQTTVTAGGLNTPSVNTALGTPKPTAVVSTAPATKNLETISNTINEASTNIANQQATNQAAILANPYSMQPGESVAAYNARIDAYNAQKNTATTEQKPTTPEETIANTPDTGNQWVYDTATGARTQQPISQPLLPSQTKVDVNAAPAADSVQTPTSTIKKFADGSYGMFDNTTGKYVGGASALDFANAKGAQKTQDDLLAIQNGTYPLTSGQQAQIDSMTNYYNSLIEAQKVENANVTGNMTGLQNLFGMGGSSVGLSAINKTISDGRAAIDKLNKQMNDSIAALRAGLQQDNVNLVLKLHESYLNAVDAKQKAIDNMHQEVVSAANKMEQRQADINVAMYKKFSDTTDPILPSDSADELKAKLATSPTYAQTMEVKKSLNDSENAYFADMLTSGFDMKKILPNLGYGTAGTNAKIAVLKPMIDKAVQAGLTGAEFGAAMIDKTAKAAAFSKLETKKDLIASNEAGVVNDFDNVLLPAAKAISKEQWQTMSPLLNKWIQTGILTTTGDPKINNYLGSLTTTLTKYSNVVAGNIGAAGATQQMNTEVQGLLNRGLSYDAIKSYVDTVAKPEMRNTVGGFDSIQQNIKDGLNHLDGTFTSGGSSNSSSDPAGLGI